MIIGLCGYPGAGKDTIGQFLVSQYSFVRISFAEPLRKCVEALDPYIEVDYEGASHIKLSQLLKELGWDETKKIPEVRRLLQVMGTEVGRNILGNELWLSIALRTMKKHEEQYRHTKKNFVFTDVRFKNESEMIVNEGGFNFWVHNPNAKPLNHASENYSNIQLSGVIDNSGDLEQLKENTRNIVTSVQQLELARKKKNDE